MSFFKTVPALLSALALFCMFSAQAVTFEQVQNVFQKTKILRARFTQEKKLKEISTPLTAQGFMLLAQEKGLIWQQESPFEMRLAATDTSFIQSMPGMPDTVLDAKSNPQMFEIITTLKAILTGDQKSLEQNFALDFSALEDTRWQLKLTPLREPFSLIFADIILRGEQYLESIELNDTQKDVTMLVFSEQTTKPDTLSAKEQTYFGR